MVNQKRKKTLGVGTAILIVIMSGRCFSIISNSNVRTVDLVAILALGILIGIFVTLLLDTNKNTNS